MNIPAMKNNCTVEIFELKLIKSKILFIDSKRAYFNLPHYCRRGGGGAAAVDSDD